MHLLTSVEEVSKCGREEVGILRKGKRKQRFGMILLYFWQQYQFKVLPSFSIILLLIPTPAVSVLLKMFPLPRFWFCNVLHSVF